MKMYCDNCRGSDKSSTNNNTTSNNSSNDDAIAIMVFIMIALRIRVSPASLRA